MDACELVDHMDLEAGHVLTEEEAVAIQIVVSLAIDFQAIQRRLGILVF